MINTGLNRTYKAKEMTTFEPIKDGDYIFRVKEISPWEKKVADINVIMKDENGENLKDEKGNNIKEMVKDVEFYNAKVKLEIVEGEYEGRIIYHDITTHPNMDFSIPAFLYGVGLDDIPASQIKELCEGRYTEGTVYTYKYNKKVQNKDTGLDEDVPREINKIKSFRPSELTYTQPENLTEKEAFDLGL